jgi:hypothetical protein
MKPVIFALLLAFTAANVTAQSTTMEDLAIIQSLFGKEKKVLVTEYMEIPEAQQAAFWSLYDSYEAERKALGKERVAIIEDYAANYGDLSDEKATELANRKFKWLANFTKMQKKYHKSIAKVIGGKQAAKFMQLEDYLENSIRLAVQESIPFIDELK